MAQIRYRLLSISSQCSRPRLQPWWRHWFCCQGLKYDMSSSRGHASPKILRYSLQCRRYNFPFLWEMSLIEAILLSAEHPAVPWGPSRVDDEIVWCDYGELVTAAMRDKGTDYGCVMSSSKAKQCRVHSHRRRRLALASKFREYHRGTSTDLIVIS